MTAIDDSRVVDGSSRRQECLCSARLLLSERVVQDQDMPVQQKNLTSPHSNEGEDFQQIRTVIDDCNNSSGSRAASVDMHVLTPEVFLCETEMANCTRVYAANQP
jgi:hypothetical protein